MIVETADTDHTLVLSIIGIPVAHEWKTVIFQQQNSFIISVKTWGQPSFFLELFILFLAHRDRLMQISARMERKCPKCFVGIFFVHLTGFPYCKHSQYQHNHTEPATIACDQLQACARGYGWVCICSYTYLDRHMQCVHFSINNARMAA